MQNFKGPICTVSTVSSCESATSHEASWAKHKEKLLHHSGSHYRHLVSAQLNVARNQTRTVHSVCGDSETRWEWRTPAGVSTASKISKKIKMKVLKKKKSQSEKVVEGRTFVAAGSLTREWHFHISCPIHFQLSGLKMKFRKGQLKDSLYSGGERKQFSICELPLFASLDQTPVLIKQNEVLQTCKLNLNLVHTCDPRRSAAVVVLSCRCCHRALLLLLLHMLCYCESTLFFSRCSSTLWLALWKAPTSLLSRIPKNNTQK